MIQQESAEQDQSVNLSPISRLLRDRTARAAAAVFLVAGLTVGLGAGYVVGQQRPAIHEAEVTCLSATGGISCTDEADSGHGEFWVPLDVAWTDSGGSLHVGDRPDCLPPTGRGTEGPIGISWFTVEIAGTSWKQAVGVRC